MHKKVVALGLALFFGIVSAAMLGAFFVSAAGERYASTTSVEDSLHEYQAAQTIFNLYVLKQVNNPVSAAKALLGFGDRIRVTY